MYAAAVFLPLIGSFIAGILTFAGGFANEEKNKKLCVKLEEDHQSCKLPQKELRSCVCVAAGKGDQQIQHNHIKSQNLNKK